MNIVRHAGEVKKARTLKGVEVGRKPKLFVKEYNQEVPCAPYDNHFIYATDPRLEGASAFMCTCGSAAVVINPDVVSQRMLVCLLHATTGKHTTGG